MRTDQAFVLLLILLLPLTGCIDTIGEVDAENPEEDAAVPAPNSTFIHEVVFVDNGSNVTMTFNNTIVQLVDSSREDEYERQVTGAVAQLDIDCGDEFSVYTRTYPGDFFPTIPGTECQITFATWDDGPATFVILQYPAVRA